MSALQKSIELAGGQAQLAEACGVVQSAVAAWVKRGRVPAQYCPAIELATGIACEQLRPDVAWHVLRRQTAPQIKQAA